MSKILEYNFSNKYTRLTRHIPRLVDEKTGIINSLESLDKPEFSPDFYYYKAIVSNTSIFNDIDNIGISAGTSSDEETSIVKAVGEAIERYCSAIYNYKDLHLSTYNDLKMNAIHPSEFQTFSDSQFDHEDFHLKKFTSETAIHWVEGIHCQSREQIYIPAAFVYCPYLPDKNNNEVQIAENISTGLAAHCSYEECALNALLEVIERNNFMFTWLTRRSCPIVNPSSLNSTHNHLIKKYTDVGYEITLLYNTGVDNISSFIGILKGVEQNTVPLIIGSATHLNPASAISKCLEELALMERYCRNKMNTDHPISSYDKVRTLEDHVFLWLQKDFIHNADFLHNNNLKISLHDIDNLETQDAVSDLNTLTTQVSKNGYSCYFCDITSSDIRSMGLIVGRALIPGYIPLNKSHLCNPMRAKYLIQNYYANNNIEDFDKPINEIPHPFA